MRIFSCRTIKSNGRKHRVLCRVRALTTVLSPSSVSGFFVKMNSSCQKVNVPGGAQVLLNALKSIAFPTSSSNSHRFVRLGISHESIHIQYSDRTSSYTTSVSVFSDQQRVLNDHRSIAVLVDLPDLTNVLTCCHLDSGTDLCIEYDSLNCSRLNFVSSDELSIFSCEIKLISEDIVIPATLAQMSNTNSEGRVVSLLMTTDILANAFSHCLDSQFVTVNVQIHDQAMDLVTLKSLGQRGGIGTVCRIPLNFAEQIESHGVQIVQPIEFSILGKDVTKIHALLTIPGSPKLEMHVLIDGLRFRRRLISNHDGMLTILTSTVED